MLQPTNRCFMWNALQYALRGAFGFGLGAVILFGVVYLAAQPPDRTNEEISIVGEWQGSYTPVHSARFDENGSFRFLTLKGKRTAGTYQVIDATNARLVSEGAWKRATLVPNPDYPGMSSTKLILIDEKGDTIELRWFRKSPPDPREGRGQSWSAALVVPFIAGAVGAIVLTLGSDKVVRGAAGFGCASIPAAFIILFTMLSLQGGGKPDYVWGAIGCGVGFGLVGAIGGLAIKPVLFLPGALSFGLAGAIWGGLGFWMEYGGPIAEGTLGKLLSLLVLVAPFMLGGGLFGAAVGVLGLED
jgi:hypothetical protein